MGDLSAHFSSWEFADHSTGRLERTVDPRLLETLECVRALTGRPLQIVSGWRSVAHNRAVGGARRSQHLYGRAADIPAGRCTLAEAHRCGAVGVGLDRHGWAVHLDVRPGPQVTFYDF